MHDGPADLAIFGSMQDGNWTEAKPIFNPQPNPNSNHNLA